jgi:hypothetical protein
LIFDGIVVDAVPISDDQKKSVAEKAHILPP